MAASARIDELRSKFDDNPRRYFASLANEYRKAGDLSTAIAICRTAVCGGVVDIGPTLPVVNLPSPGPVPLSFHFRGRRASTARSTVRPIGSR